jgi:glutamate 5-kinase
VENFLYFFRKYGKVKKVCYGGEIMRVVIKIGSSSLTHEETGRMDLYKMEHLVRAICDLKNRGMDVCLVSSGAIAVGKGAIGLKERPSAVATKQACAAVGQAKLMMIYQKLFSEYNRVAGQVLMTKNLVDNTESRANVQNAFEELFRLGVIPIVNENDTVSTYEMQYLVQFGDNDTLSAIVASLVGADLLILLSDIDGLYTDDPHRNPNAKLIREVCRLDDGILSMAKDSTGSSVGTGGMATKLTAARIATSSGADMIIANGKDMQILYDIFSGDYVGTRFIANRNPDFHLADFLRESAADADGDR